ncbi:hypothetical protein M406DRAFT_44514 [Cryphonectria parasitica EP155]|uniref:non-specific serine/threonine protein kinase n=1 Tax=Cryphonectria parasitica (strain ATCC 38755 / EP155) TaxID=660469 RepID=A0A9P4YAG0_CRYP1|nr:uncharacterized protein M406DRAFT_44514 [Cryphonectria parasitica EP155]KAF3769394.1 hypothetical protein M406DRAFT_44514 [Cryphonectria parasitica EP155]
MDVHNQHSVQGSSSRVPLGENPKYANSVPSGGRPPQQLNSVYETESKENFLVPAENVKASRKPKQSARNTSRPPVDPRLSSVLSQASQSHNASNRNSQVSTVSDSTVNSAESRLKSYIGPWQLGKTLGKGSSARVRLARHRVTHQSVAVKIISKKTAYLSQAGSIAQLDRLEKHSPAEEDGVRRLPVTVEREIAIMKLIEHPNIIQILDVWENRNEIYLILEYCESSDMFSWINKYGPLSEHDTVYVFRQMMCAMEYCHSFNICHRDLKPENILLSDDGEVKIIDFGMAALHQNDQNLRTACGSPHYAAPELLKSKTYRGDKADVWSMGVILYAMLAQRLPFDDPHLPTILSLSKRAIYTMPDELSRDAKDMIRRILVTDPDKRISIVEMWDHPLIKKYDGKPGFEKHKKQPVDMQARSTNALLSPRDIDPQILRQLRAMWHSSDIKEIKAKLTSKGPNEQKVFYHLLLARRERLLENYDPELTHSSSDYHHLLRPKAWATRVSTRDFHKHGRTPSRFTVISTIADTEAGGTVRSYDPYHASRDLAPVQASHAKITIHRGKLEPGAARSVASGSVPSRVGTGAPSRVSRRMNSSLRARTVSYAQSQPSSMSSIRSSRHGTSSVLVKQRNKRGVDFSSVRKGVAAQGSQRRRGVDARIIVSASIAGDQTTYGRDNTSPQSPCNKKIKQEDTDSEDALNILHSIEPVFDEEMIRFSHSIAKDCDDAFGSSLIGSPSDTGARNIRSSLTPFSIDFDPPSIQRTPEPVYNAVRPWDSRPLPPTPPNELTPSPPRLKSTRVDASSRYDADSALSVAPLKLPSTSQRRTASAPLYATHQARDATPLPSIFENSSDAFNGQPRIVSAPTPSMAGALPTPNDNKNLDFLARAEQTIRLVESPTARKAAPSSLVPAPLNVRKKASRDGTDPIGLRQVSRDEQIPKKKQSFHNHQLKDLPEEPAKCGKSSSNGSSLGRKKTLSSWFRRASKTSSKGDVSEKVDTSTVDEDKNQEMPAPRPPQRFCSTSTDAAPPVAVMQPSKKKSLMFWKSGSKSDHRMSIAGKQRGVDSDSSSPDPERVLARAGTTTHHGEDNHSANARKIEPQQNWLARLFRVKPAMRYLCLQMSCRRARQEVTILLREWRKWGMRDVEVDKDRNIVFARVGKKNSVLHIKEVHFAVEIITVIEHGRRNHLSIIRFTQEKGAASSFHKVVDTMNSVFSSRNILVQDGRKAKMMIKTLNS